MLANRNEYLNEDQTIGYVEAVYASGNVLKSIYFPKSKRLFISFSRGHTYSYNNVSEEIYNEFENAESQGKYFMENLNKPDKYPTRREFNLYPSEVSECKLKIVEAKNKLINENKD
jgi:hypothetical protein